MISIRKMKVVLTMFLGVLCLDALYTFLSNLSTLFMKPPF